MTGVHRTTVSKLLCDLGRACSEYQDKAFRNLKCKRLQCDEIWSFVGAKEKNCTAEMSLINAKALYFCAHDHFYDRMSVVRRTSPSGPEVFQITAGTAGAPFYTGAQYAGSVLWKQQRAAHFENVYGYMLVEVDGGKATITFKGHGPSCCGKTGQSAFAAMDQMVYESSGRKTVSY